MSIFETSRSPWASRVLSVFRIVVGLLFMSAGTIKLFGFPPNPHPAMSIPLMSQLGAAGILETFGGLAIVLGLFTRPVAFILSGEMAVAYFQVHFPLSYFPSMNGGQDAILFCFTYLYFAFVGGGTWSIDTLLARSKQSRQAAQDSTPRAATQ